MAVIFLFMKDRRARANNEPEDPIAHRKDWAFVRPWSVVHSPIRCQCNGGCGLRTQDQERTKHQEPRTRDARYIDLKSAPDRSGSFVIIVRCIFQLPSG